jgi:hypothetical protein
MEHSVRHLLHLARRKFPSIFRRYVGRCRECTVKGHHWVSDLALHVGMWPLLQFTSYCILPTSQCSSSLIIITLFLTIMCRFPPSLFLCSSGKISFSMQKISSKNLPFCFFNSILLLWSMIWVFGCFRRWQMRCGRHWDRGVWIS